MKKYYFVSWNHGNGIYCTNLATAESAADVYKAYADRDEVTVRPAENYEIESAKRRGMPVTECPHTEPEQTETAEEENEMKQEQFITALAAQLATIKNRSAWDRGVQEYAEELAEELAENIRGGYVDMDDMYSFKTRRAAMLNGAEDWMQYSWSGCSLIYDYQIAERLCNPSELKKTRGGERRPNSREEWLDTQARALGQAWRRVDKAITDALEIIMNSQPDTSDIIRDTAAAQETA